MIEIPKRAAVVSCGPAVLASAAVLAPYFSTNGYALLTVAIFWFFSPVCHQDPARSFWIFGAPVAVCARCLGIYLGAAAGAWIPASRRLLLPGLALFAALNLADVLTEAAVWHGNWKLMRFLLGAVLGLAAGALVADSVRSNFSPRLRVSAANQSSR